MIYLKRIGVLILTPVAVVLAVPVGIVLLMVLGIASIPYYVVTGKDLFEGGI